MAKRKAIPVAVKCAVLKRSGGICEADGCNNAEIWTHVVGFGANYEVSNYGRIRSCARLVRNSRSPCFKVWREKILTATQKDNGYLTVMLRQKRKSVRLHVHRIVLEAFCGPCPTGSECRHIDGDRTNNRLENLAWGTKQENMADKRKHGTHLEGERCWASKLTREKVREVRRAAKLGESRAVLAKRYGIARSSLDDAIAGRTWAHVK